MSFTQYSMACDGNQQEEVHQSQQRANNLSFTFSKVIAKKKGKKRKCDGNCVKKKNAFLKSCELSRNSYIRIVWQTDTKCVFYLFKNYHKYAILLFISFIKDSDVQLLIHYDYRIFVFKKMCFQVLNYKQRLQAGNL